MFCADVFADGVGSPEIFDTVENAGSTLVESVESVESVENADSTLAES